MSCPLCKRKPIMPVIYEDDRFWITYCKVHKSCPMIVVKEHVPVFSESDIEWINKFVSSKWPKAKIRFTMDSIKDHAHCHIEKEGE